MTLKTLLFLNKCYRMHRVFSRLCIENIFQVLHNSKFKPLTKVHAFIESIKLVSGWSS